MPDRVPDGPSRAGRPGAGHGGGDDRRVRYGPMPDRVRYGPSPTHVSSRAVWPDAGSRAVWPVAYARLVVSQPVCAGRGHGWARRTPVICHAPAQHTPVADAANRCLRTFILLHGRGVS